MKKLSSGMIIINSENKILGCKGYGKKGDNSYDLPKGGIEIGETPYQAAVRETEEETGLDISNIDAIDLGQFKYNSKKNLHLFKCYLDSDLDILHCDSEFKDNFGNMVPEMVGYKWIDLNDIDKNFYRGLVTVLNLLKFLKILN